jgi:DeoR family transcriptional regulator, glycerol-3-phosphate regulon repressor
MIRRAPGRSRGTTGYSRVVWGDDVSGKRERSGTRDSMARHEHIEKLVKERGFVTIAELSEQLGVTVQTIRRDLSDMADVGRITRFHGGAGRSSSIQNIEYSDRKVLNIREKEKIARLVAQHVPANSSLFINIGTTTEAVARALLNHEGLRFITNNLNVASLVASSSATNVIVTGGLIRNRDGGIIGQAACDMIGQFSVDIGIIGISGIDADGTLLDYDYDEVRAAQAIMRNARKVFLVADHTKFARRPMVRLGSITQVSALFTDMPPPPGIRELLTSSGVALHIVPSGT